MGIPNKPSDIDSDLALIDSWGGIKTRYTTAQRTAGFGSTTILGRNIPTYSKNYENNYYMQWTARANNGLDYINGITELYLDNGVANSFLLTINNGDNPSSYFEGLKIRFFVKESNTDTCYANVNSLGAKIVKTPTGNELVSGNISSGQYIELVYCIDGDCFIFSNFSSENLTAEDISYDNSVSLLSAINLQDAIDELSSEKAEKAGNGLQLFDVKAALSSTNATNLSQFSALLATNGYQKLASGLIIQWGRTTRTSWTNTGASSQEILNFPILFPNAVLFCLANQFGSTGSDGSTEGVAVTANQSQITVTNHWSGGCKTFIPWIAIGY